MAGLFHVLWMLFFTRQEKGRLTIAGGGIDSALERLSAGGQFLRPKVLGFLHRSKLWSTQAREV
jgi:hypothetical protein